MVRPISSEKNPNVRAAMEGVRFLGVMLGAAILLYFLFLPIEINLQNAETNHVRGMLSTVGVETRDAQLPNQFFVNEKLVEISPLCSGLVEMVLLIGAIVATRGASMRKKIMGIGIGIFILYLFNLIRIVVSVLQLRYTSLAFATLTHDILFRVILILGFALVYAGWVHAARVMEWLAEKKMVGE